MIFTIIIYIAFVVITIYNIKTNYDLIKYRSGKRLRNPDELSVRENLQLGKLVKEKRKWSLLGQVLFFVSLFIAVKKDLVFLAFFMTLYSVTMISVTQLEKKIVKLLDPLK